MGGGPSKQSEVKIATDQVESKNAKNRNSQNPQTKAIAKAS